MGDSSRGFIPIERKLQRNCKFRIIDLVNGEQKIKIPKSSYLVLEQIIKYWCREIDGVTEPTLHEKLRGKNTSKTKVIEDIGYLCSLGYVFCKKNGTIIPTHKGVDFYRRDHRNFLISANCMIPD